MTQIVDYSFARPDPAALAAQGFVGVARYLAWLPNSKAIDQAELDRLHAAGLAVCFVWEVGTDWTTWDGADADRQLAALGVPASVPVYWAVDKDVPDGNYGLVGSLLDGVNSARPRGIYGGSGLVQYQLDHGHARYGWIAGATSWGHGEAAPGAQLLQRVGGAPAGCDVDDVRAADWGQYAPGITAVPASDPGEDEPMMFIVKGDASGEWWLTDFLTKRWCPSVGDAGLVVFSYATQGGKCHTADGGQPFVLPQVDVDAIPTLSTTPVAGPPGPAGPAGPPGPAGSAGLTDPQVHAIVRYELDQTKLGH